MKLLLAFKATIDNEDDSGWTPLMVAAKSGNVQAVVHLLDQEADVGVLNQDGETFFDIAIDFRQEMVCKAVLDSDR